MPTISEPGLAVNRSFEGRSLKAYRDEVGVWTIGYGQTNDDAAVLGFTIKEGVTITEAQAESLLRASMTRLYVPPVNEAMGPATPTQAASDAGYSFDYNTGRIKTASWVASLIRGDMPSVHTQIMAYNHAGGNVLAGLTRRRNREWMMISAGDYGPEGAASPLDMDTGKPVVVGHGTSVPAAPATVQPGSASTPVIVAGIPPWLQRMNDILGVYRKPGSDDSPAILEMARVCKGSIAASYNHDQIAWCALAVNYCLVSTGFKGDDSLAALDVRKIGTKLNGPAVGALATKTRTGGGHTFMVTGRTASGQLVGTGGNQSGDSEVCDEIFDASVCQFNWPAGYPLPAKVGIGTLPIVTPRPHVHKDYTAAFIDHPTGQATVVPGHLDGTPGMLQLGDTGPEVADFQRMLIAAGFDIEADGDYGPATEKAVLTFQRAHPQLDADGIAGPATRAALTRDAAARAALKGAVAKGAGAGGLMGAIHNFIGAMTPWLYGALAVAVVGSLCYIAWQYRDEIRGWLAKPKPASAVLATAAQPALPITGAPPAKQA